MIRPVGGISQDRHLDLSQLGTWEAIHVWSAAGHPARIIQAALALPGAIRPVPETLITWQRARRDRRIRSALFSAFLKHWSPP